MKQFELQKPISQLFNALESQCFVCELFQVGCSERNQIKPIISEKSFCDVTLELNVARTHTHTFPQI